MRSFTPIDNRFGLGDSELIKMRFNKPAKTTPKIKIIKKMRFQNPWYTYDSEVIMAKKSFVKNLSNLTLDENLQQLVIGEREILAEIIIYIREVDCRKMYLEFVYPSLFEYMTKRMNYSNASAQRRIDAARISFDVPEVLEHLESGDINLSQLSVMAQAIRFVDKSSQKVDFEIKENLVTQILGKDLSQTEVIVSDTLNIPIKEASRAKHQKDESV